MMHTRTRQITLRATRRATVAARRSQSIAATPPLHKEQKASSSTDFRCAYCGTQLYWWSGIADEPWPHFDRFECQDAYCRKHGVRYGEWARVVD